MLLLKSASLFFAANSHYEFIGGIPMNIFVVLKEHLIQRKPLPFKTVKSKKRAPSLLLTRMMSMLSKKPLC